MPGDESLITAQLMELVGQEGPAREILLTPELVGRVEETVRGSAFPFVDGQDAPPYFLLAFETPVSIPETPDAPASLLTGDEWTLHRPARVGERLTVRGRLAAVTERFGSRFGHMLNTYSAWTISDTQGQPVAEIGRSMIRYRPPEGGVPAEPDDPALARSEPPREQESGRADLSEGSPLPSAVIRPTLAQVVRYCALTWNFLGFFFDPEEARRMGLPGPIVPGPFKMALIVERLAQLAGPDGRVVHARCAWRRPDRTGWPFTVRGMVTHVEAEGRGRQVSCDVWTETAEGARSVAGAATLLIP